MESSMKQVVFEEEVSPCSVAPPQGFAQFIPARHQCPEWGFAAFPAPRSSGMLGEPQSQSKHPPAPISTPPDRISPHPQDSGNGCCCPGCCLPCATCCAKCCTKCGVCCAKCCCLPKCCRCPKCPKCPKCPGCASCSGCLTKSLCFLPRLLCYLPRKLLSCCHLRCLLVVVLVVVLLVIVIAAVLLMWLSVDQRHGDTVSGDSPPGHPDSQGKGMLMCLRSPPRSPSRSCGAGWGPEQPGKKTRPLSTWTAGTATRPRSSMITRM